MTHGLMLEAATTLETSVNFYQATRHDLVQDSHPNPKII
jgi:hypothetical protein